MKDKVRHFHRTRLHSSRVNTDCRLTISQGGGGSQKGDYLRRDTPQREDPPTVNRMIHALDMDSIPGQFVYLNDIYETT